MKDTEEAIDTLFEAYGIMTEMVPYAMGVAEKKHTVSIMYVAKMTNLVAEMLLQDAPESATIAMEALGRLAEHCEKMCREMKDDENMQACADECKKVMELSKT